MKSRTIMVVKQPRERLWEALSERAGEVATRLDEIESAELQSRTETSRGLIRCVHVWRARPNVAPIFASHIDQETLEWTGRTEWRPDAYESHWIIEPHFMRESVRCSGVMRFAPAIGGRGTRLGVELELTGLRGWSGVETIASTLVATNFRKLVEATVRLIEDDPRAPGA